MERVEHSSPHANASAHNHAQQHVLERQGLERNRLERVNQVGQPNADTYSHANASAIHNTEQHVLEHPRMEHAGMECLEQFDQNVRHLRRSPASIDSFLRANHEHDLYAE